MPLSELLQIGDRVVFEVGSERRRWMDVYKDVPDGIMGVVCGFHDAVIYKPRAPVFVLQPGVYHYRGAVSVLLPDGRIVPGDSSVKMVDKEEEGRRDVAMRDERGILQTEYFRLCDLPETKFWERDRVRVRFPYPCGGRERKMTIGQIDYGYIHHCCNDGSPYPFYGVDQVGTSTNAEESWIELIERGNVWKFYHDEPITFGDIKEEASFFQMIGQAEEVRNPINDLFVWTGEGVLDAILSGAVHGFSMSDDRIGSGPYIGAVRFKDETLGERVAKATLEDSGRLNRW